MSTTIQISDEVRRTLEKMKIYARETYNEIIERMIEDELTLSEQTKNDIQEARKRMERGKGISHEEAKRKLGL